MPTLESGVAMDGIAFIAEGRVEWWESEDWSHEGKES
jgi:hypothetical protein